MFKKLFRNYEGPARRRLFLLLGIVAIVLVGVALFFVSSSGNTNVNILKIGFTYKGASKNVATAAPIAEQAFAPLPEPTAEPQPLLCPFMNQLAIVKWLEPQLMTSGQAALIFTGATQQLPIEQCEYNLAKYYLIAKTNNGMGQYIHPEILPLAYSFLDSPKLAFRKARMKGEKGYMAIGSKIIVLFAYEPVSMPAGQPFGVVTLEKDVAYIVINQLPLQQKSGGDIVLEDALNRVYMAQVACMSETYLDEVKGRCLAFSAQVASLSMGFQPGTVEYETMYVKIMAALERTEIYDPDLLR